MRSVESQVTAWHLRVRDRVIEELAMVGMITTTALVRASPYILRAASVIATVQQRRDIFHPRPDSAQHERIDADKDPQ